jgi:hypothetical protein
MRLQLGQYSYQYGIEIRLKILNMINFFSPQYRSPGIHQELAQVTMGIYTGGTGFKFCMDPVLNPAVCDCVTGIHTS